MKINIRTMHQPYDDDFPMEEINLVDLYKEEVEFLKKQNEFLEKSKKSKDQRQRWKNQICIEYFQRRINEEMAHLKHIKEQILMKTRTLH
tara:strand:- start:240 stop:509 length:270 start_codon:yes stop_codon:yes gene_type:complete